MNRSNYSTHKTIQFNMLDENYKPGPWSGSTSSNRQNLKTTIVSELTPKNKSKFRSAEAIPQIDTSVLLLLEITRQIRDLFTHLHGYGQRGLLQ